MNFKKITSGIVTIFILFLCINCSSSTEVDNTARVQLKLVDAPGDYVGLNVEIIDIQYNNSEDGEWQSFKPETAYPLQVDITDLIAGTSLLLTDEMIPAGMLHQIRLVLGDNNTVEIEGEMVDDTPGEIITEHLTTPSAQQSGLKIKLNQELEAGFVYFFTLDWLVNESIVKAGNSEKYILKPVIRVSAEVSSGSLKGTVTEDLLDDTIENPPLFNATISIYEDVNLIAQTTTNEAGEYMLHGIPPGDYRLEISLTDYNSYSSPAEAPITISLGEILDYGEVKLVPIQQ